MMPYVYIVQCRDGTLYTGWTTDLSARVEAHNAGRGARYTRGRRPVKLVYAEAAPDRRRALQRERAIKRLSRSQKLALIAREEGINLASELPTDEPAQSLDLPEETTILKNSQPR